MVRPLHLRFPRFAFNRACLQVLSLMALLLVTSGGDLAVAQTPQEEATEMNGSGKTAAGQTVTGESQAAKEKESSEVEEKQAEAEPKKVKIGGIHWYVDYDVALKVAQKENKPMWLHFGENPG